MSRTFTIVPSPLLIEAYTTQPSTCVVIDVLRASTTIAVALSNGAKCIYPIDSLHLAEQRSKEGHLVGAERNAQKCHFAQLGNDPLEYTPQVVANKEIYFTTTNGTHTIRTCIASGHQVVVGSFVNLAAVATYCKNKNIMAVAAGWKGQVSAEDTLFAAALAEALAPTHQLLGDFTHLMLQLWQANKQHLLHYIKKSEHYQRLVKVGKAESLPYCLTPSIIDCTPIANLTEEQEIVLLKA